MRKHAADHVDGRIDFGRIRAEHAPVRGRKLRDDIAKTRAQRNIRQQRVHERSESRAAWPSS